MTRKKTGKHPSILTLAVSAGVLLVLTGFGSLSPVFFSSMNIKHLLYQNAYVMIAALGVAFVMFGGWFDLTVSAHILTTASLIALLTGVIHVPFALMVPLALVVGGLLGAVNGFLVGKLRGNGLIVSLVLAFVLQAANVTVYQGRSFISASHLLKVLGQGEVLGKVQGEVLGKVQGEVLGGSQVVGGLQNFSGIPVPMVLVAIMFGIAWVVHRQTIYGPYIRMIGASPSVAESAGVPVARMRLTAYILSGAYFSVAALVLLGRIGSSSPTMASGAEWTCLIAGIFGNALGRNVTTKLLAVVATVLFIGMVGNGIQLIGLSIYMEYVFKGLLLFGAFYLTTKPYIKERMW